MAAADSPQPVAKPGLRRVVGLARDHADIAIGAALLLSILAFPRLAPTEFYAQGLVGGALLAMQAAGIVLIFRSDRIVNFAQVQVGAVAGLMFQAIVTYKTPFWLISGVCESCVSYELFELVQDNQVARLGPVLEVINYVLAAIAALAFGAAISLLIHYGVVRRLREAPRLVLTVATLFIAQVLAQLGGQVSGLMSSQGQKELLADAESTGLPPVPAPFPFEIGVFSRADITTLLVAVLAIAGVVLYLRMSSTGTAIRAAADNTSRVETLGVNAGAMTARVWLLAGMLSTFAGMASTFTSAGGATSAFEAPFAVRVLAVALLAGFVSITSAAALALVFGVVDSAAEFSFASLAPVDGALVLIVVAGLLLQRGGLSRGQLEAASSWQAAREIRPIPSELSGLQVVRSWLRGTRVLIAILLLGMPWVFSPGQLFIATTYLIFAIIALSLLVLTGWAGQISLGQFGFAAVGAYVVAVWDLPLLLALPAAAFAGAILAVALGLPALRLRGLDLAIVTLAFSLSVTSLLLNSRYLGKHLPPSVPRPSLLAIDLDDQRTFYYFVLTLVVLTVASVAGLRRGRFGRALIGARDNERAAQAYGVSLLRIRLTAIAISGGLAGFAGALFGYLQFGVKPESFSPEQSVTLFLMAVIGGFGSIAGPILGATYLGITNLFSSSPAVQLLATGLGGLLVVLAAPAGLVGVLSSIRDAMLRRVAARARIIVPSLVADIDRDTAARQRVALAEKMRPGGGSVFVPSRYRLDRQWAVEEPTEQDNVPVNTSFGVTDEVVHRG